MTVERLLKKSIGGAKSLSPRLFITDVISKLESRNVGVFIVSANNNTIDGVISERDIVRGLERYAEETLDQRIRDVMNKHVITCTKHTPIIAVMAQLCDLNIRHMLVVEGNRFVGMISIEDVIKLRIDEIRTQAEALGENACQ